MQVTLTDNCAISSRHITDEGFMSARAIFSSVGIQKYKESELFDGGDENVIINAFRPPETLSDQKFLDSLSMSPITKGHPDEFVNSSNYNALSRGMTCQDVSFQDNNAQGGILITDKNEVEKIQKLGKVSLSLGYGANILKKSGIFDGESYTVVIKDMRVNHAAMIEDGGDGRCERAKILDKKEVNMSDDKDKTNEDKDKEIDKKVQDQDLVSGIVSQLLSNKGFMNQILQAVTKSPNLVKQLGAAIASQTTPSDGGNGDGDGGDSTGNPSDNTDLPSASNQLDHKTVIDSAVIERVRLNDTAKNVFNMKEKDFEEKTNREIMIDCLQDKSITDATSDDFIKGRFQGMTEQRRNAVDSLSNINVKDGKSNEKDKEGQTAVNDMEIVNSAITQQMRGN